MTGCNANSTQQRTSGLAKQISINWDWFSFSKNPARVYTGTQQAPCSLPPKKVMQSGNLEPHTSTQSQNKYQVQAPKCPSTVQKIKRERISISVCLFVRVCACFARHVDDLDKVLVNQPRRRRRRSLKGLNSSAPPSTCTAGMDPVYQIPQHPRRPPS